MDYFVKYGFENKYFVILFLEEISLIPWENQVSRPWLILFGLSTCTLRKFCDDYILLLVASILSKEIKFSHPLQCRFLVSYPFSSFLYKKSSIQDARKWKNLLTFDQNNFA